MGTVSHTEKLQINVFDILRKGHLAPITKELPTKMRNLLRASSNAVLQVLATGGWPVRASLGDLLQAAVEDTSSRIWNQAFDLSDNLTWLAGLIPVESHELTASPTILRNSFKILWTWYVLSSWDDTRN